jgi:redox-sensitive bicupin YhaK (pirin superfamily)
MRFIQMWILPSERGLPPSLEQRVFTKEDRADRLLRVISGDGGDAVRVHQDADVFVSSLSQGVSAAHTLGEGRGAYLYVISGATSMNGQPLKSGDAAAIEGEPELALEADESSELILVDVRL